MPKSAIAVKQIDADRQVQSGLVPLVLDLDNTLIRTDLLHETVFAYLKQNALGLFSLVAWLLKGKAHLKQQLARHVTLEVDDIPLNDEIVAYAEAEKAKGREIVLATAADSLLAIRIARRFPFIDRTIASDGVTNLKGATKAEKLAEMFPDGFVYAGDSKTDLAVWKHAKGAVLVGTAGSVGRAAARLTQIEHTIKRPARLKDWVKEARLHQWAKNALVFVPLMLGGHMLDLAAWTSAGIAFLALGILASSTYLLNDLWDIADDRRHWSKRNRPLAAGRISIAHAVAAMPVAMIAAFALGALVNPLVVVTLGAYLALTVAYSMGIKRKPILDAFTLAVLFTIRLVLGIVAVGVMASPWLLVFSMFLFASLSFAKRNTEVQRMTDNGGSGRISGRGYFTTDAPFIMAMGVSSGIGSVLILVLYLTQDALAADFYSDSVWLWLMPAALFLWIGRIWMLSFRGELNDDPVAFAMKDPKSLMLAAGLALGFFLAWIGI
jgi:4-hydroxybenzoate polyprenyltransferase/phosphoserine phosphatase